MAFGLQNKFTARHTRNQKIYGVRARYLWREKLGSEPRVISFNLKVKPCEEDYFAELPNIVLPTGLHLQDLYCLSDDQGWLPEEFQKMFVKGRFDSENQGKLSITIEKCKKNCEEDHIINDFLKKSNVAVYFVNNGQNLGSFSEPFKQNLAGLFTGLDPNFSKTHEIFMKEASVQTDSGIFFSNIKQQSYFLMESQRETVTSNDDGSLYQLEVQMGTTSDFHVRKYPRISVIIAQIGGYMKVFLLLLYFYKPFLDRMYYKDLINQLYKVEGVDGLKNSAFEDKSENNNENGSSWPKFNFKRSRENIKVEKNQKTDNSNSIIEKKEENTINDEKVTQYNILESGN